MMNCNSDEKSGMICQKACSTVALLLCLTTGALAQNSEKPASETARQIQLQQEFLKWKFGLFLHFNIATFNGEEWANGYENPLTFAPDKLDCGQWADAAKAAGMKYAVLTVKHTGGWCLWDSAYTTHDITAFKNFKHGKGDIVREFVNAFRSRGIKVGFYYCMPGNYDNRNGNTLPEGKPSLHGMPPEAAGDFQGFVKKQLTELLTRYGPIDLIWCDQYNDMFNMDQWHNIMALIRKLQPNCLIIANNCHNFHNTDIYSYEYPYLKNAEHKSGYPPVRNTIPSEVCDTIWNTGNWFWQPGLDSHIRSAEDIVGALQKCNERRANYLLDVGPDRSGQITEANVKRLEEIGELRREKGDY
jgi:alpha-L-fucosidase